MQYGIVAGHVLVVLFALLTGIVSIIALDSIARDRERVEDGYVRQLLQTERLRSFLLQSSAQARAYVITANPVHLEENASARARFDANLQILAEGAKTEEERGSFNQVKQARDEYDAAVSRAIALFRAGGKSQDVAALFDSDVIPKLAATQITIDDASVELRVRVDSARRNAEKASTRTIRSIVAVVEVTVALIAILGLLNLQTIHRIGRGSRQMLALLDSEQRARESAIVAKQQLAESVAQLERVNADLDAFAGRIAHDLRNLLMPISLVPARLRQAQDKASLEKIGATLERFVSRANATLDGLLAFSRAGRSVGDVIPASVKHTIDEVIEDLTPLATAAQVDVDTRIDDVKVACSPALLRVVMHNLIGNAIKFVVESKERHVCVRAHRADGGVEIECIDTGPGIPTEAIPRIFEPLYRVKGSTAPGSGIGLATVHRIVSTHGGRIECASEVGQGTTFRVWLPEAQ